jgi:hypothetical protein
LLGYSIAGTVADIWEKVMALPYSNATAGKRALDEIQNILKSFGCNKFASGTDWDTGEIYIQFEHRNRMINLKVSSKGYAAALLKEDPWTSTKHCSKSQHESKALSVGEVAVYSILRDWVKGQVTAVECGVMSFEAAFLSHIMLPSGLSVIEEISKQKLLPAPEDD